ncbi:MAG: ABC transporter permease, partial [Acidobacteriia bacterium]|nr:ABC transporter permease [Terriglobia bacterium]
DMRGMNYIDDLVRDLGYAARGFRRSPGFAVFAILIMALGIGANTAVFSVVNAVLLKPLAYRDPNRIVTLSEFSNADDLRSSLSRQVSVREFQDWQAQSSSFEALAMYATRETAVIRGSEAEYARVAGVSPEFFRVFAIEPALGRFPTADETKASASGAVMISYGYWQGHFGGDPRALGQTVRAFGLRTIVGVLPPGFRFPGNADLWVTTTGTDDPPTARNYLAVARLKLGVSLERAQSEMAAIAKRLEQKYSDTNKGWSIAIARMRDDMVRDVRRMLYLLLGAVALVLLIACANTATLLLGKAVGRTREVAVRAAMGASRLRIVRQLVTESLLLSIVAGLLGIVLAAWGSKALVALAPAELPRMAETAIDRWVLAFTFGISVITSVLFGLVPAIYASRFELSDALKEGGTRLVSGRGLVRVRGALVVAEIALAVTLVSGAGLLLKSFVALNHVALGFRPENVLVMRATVPGSFQEATPRARQFFREMLAQIGRLPGVLAAGATMAPPGSIDSSGGYFIDRLPTPPDWTKAPAVVLSIITPGTFAALGVPVKLGRDFSDSDTPERPLVAIVNEALVRQSFGNQSPLGRKIFCPFDDLRGMTIVGVVGDVHQLGPEREPMPECYMTYGQHTFNGLTLSIVTRTAGNPSTLAKTFQRLAREQSAEVPLKFTTMKTMLSEHVAAPRFRTLLVGIFAGLALVLAMAGVYGVMAYSVSQRSAEIGLRMALGATAGSILRLILKQGLVYAFAGLALGVAAAISGTRLLTSMLFQVKPNDVTIYCCVAVLLATAVLIATYLPARRASGIEPLRALRQD